MMSGIRGKETKPEIALRSALHKEGFRFRKNVRALPGTPDIVLRKYRAVVFVNGCFWHGHECELFKWPSTRPEFWREKIHKNKERDARAMQKLGREGWRILIVWECAMKGPRRVSRTDLVQKVSDWLLTGPPQASIGGERDE